MIALLSFFVRSDPSGWLYYGALKLLCLIAWNLEGQSSPSLTFPCCGLASQWFFWFDQSFIDDGTSFRWVFNIFAYSRCAHHCILPHLASMIFDMLRAHWVLIDTIRSSAARPQLARRRWRSLAFPILISIDQPARYPLYPGDWVWPCWMKVRVGTNQPISTVDTWPVTHSLESFCGIASSSFTFQFFEISIRGKNYP